MLLFVLRIKSQEIGTACNETISIFADPCNYFTIPTYR
jgi:hypothetical protein